MSANTVRFSKSQEFSMLDHWKYLSLGLSTLRLMYQKAKY